MSYLIGALLAILVCGAALLLRLDRDRRFYPAMMIVVALFYVLFAILGRDAGALPIEAAIFAAFLVVALLGYRVTPWLIVIAIATHGIFDLTHHLFFQNHGVPGWWPGFCSSFDVVAAIFLGALLAWRKRLDVSAFTHWAKA
jgi:hypothetical protein